MYTGPILRLVQNITLLHITDLKVKMLAFNSAGSVEGNNLILLRTSKISYRYSSYSVYLTTLKLYKFPHKHGRRQQLDTKDYHSFLLAHNNTSQ